MWQWRCSLHINQCLCNVEFNPLFQGHHHGSSVENKWHLCFKPFENNGEESWKKCTFLRHKLLLSPSHGLHEGKGNHCSPDDFWNHPHFTAPKDHWRSIDLVQISIWFKSQSNYPGLTTGDIYWGEKGVNEQLGLKETSGGCDNN